MEKNFKEYYKPTEKDFKHLWNNCEFIFDANVLLNTYRYSPKTTDEFFDVLRNVQDRIWMPHQAALEYQRNRFSIIEEQVEKCKKLETLLEKNEILKSLKGIKRHPFIDTVLIISELEKTFDNLKDVLKNSRDNYPNTIRKDNLRDIITEIFDGKIGVEFSNKDLENTYKKGKERFANKIPPGFEDKSKPGNQKYGDCVLWHQIITHAKIEGKPVIFITDDAKKDWWLKSSNNTIIGPHPLLIREMRLKSNVDFYMYKSKMFMEYAKNYLGFNVDDSSLQEIETIQKDIRIEYITESTKHLHNKLRHHQLEKEYWEAQAEAQVEAQAELYAEAEMQAEMQAEMYAELYAEAEMQAEIEAEIYAEMCEEAEMQAEMEAEAQAEVEEEMYSEYMEQKSQEDVESDDKEDLE